MRQSCVRRAQTGVKNDGGYFEHLL